MRIFSLATIEDFKSYISVLFFLIVPLILILLIPYFLYTTAFIDSFSYAFDFVHKLPTVLRSVLFAIVPGITAALFLFWNAKTIFIEESAVEIEYKSGNREKIAASDITQFIAYKTATPWTWGDLSRPVNYPSLFPIAIRKMNSSTINLFMRGEIWNALKETYPDVLIVQVSIFNRYSFFIALIALLNFINGVVYFILAFENSVK
ncbi:MAG: hypothetical protein NTU85_01925 [Candidatus Kaiserbacteria bacterium]|nr:hypothetical protein [Candidatus Kaiserbacteria bacterium]